jgi:L,D-transpeptidase catalytic domain/Putative peptidoglycan binding domain
VVRKGLAVAGALALVAIAALGFASGSVLSARAAGSDTGTTTTGTSSTTTTTTTTTPPPPTTPPKRPLIAAGVSVGNVLVGWLTPRQATELVRKTYEKPLELVISPTRTIEIAPSELGARADIEKAIRRARSARPGVSIPLDVEVSRERIRKYLLALKLDREPVDAGVVLRGLRPTIVKAAPGRHLKLLRTAFLVRIALKTHSRDPIEVAFAVLKPKVLRVKVRRTAIVIMRDTKELRFYLDQKLYRAFPVATGQAAYPTPTGSFEIAVMERNPWWRPPPSPWAKDEDPVPPGPGNPLGTRWMGLSEPYVGIHGTPDAASIGYSASHGCIRMRIPDAEWLFERVKVGTPVFIVAR